MLSAVDAVAVEASFSEADVAPIKVGQAATISLANHPGVTYPAKVTQIDPAGTASGSLVKFGVQLEFTTPPADLLLGQSATVAVTTDQSDNTLYVPAGAVTTTNGKSTVTVQSGTADRNRHGNHGPKRRSGHRNHQWPNRRPKGPGNQLAPTTGPRGSATDANSLVSLVSRPACSASGERSKATPAGATITRNAH